MAKSGRNTIVLDVPPPAEPFGGFSTKTISFLHGLKKNNNKAWFEDHRKDYENELREPCKQLVRSMASVFALKKLPLIADERRSLFRINRDIRFSKDKSPYKTHIGIVFPMKGSNENEWSGMYMFFEPSGAGDVKTGVGGGVYMPSPAYLKLLRERIADELAAFKKLNTKASFRKVYEAGITGESLKRIPKGFDEEHPGAEYIKMKEFLFNSPLTKKDLLSTDLPEILTERIQAALPVLEFFTPNR